MVAFCIFLCAILNLILYRTITKSKLNLNELVFQKHKKASKRLLFINFVYMTCSSPLLIGTFMIVTKLSQQIDNKQESAMTLAKYFMAMSWCFSIYVLYSGLNAVIYVGFDQKIVAFYMNCFDRKRTLKGNKH